jgi:hypothetical protein
MNSFRILLVEDNGLFRDRAVGRCSVVELLLKHMAHDWIIAQHGLSSAGCNAHPRTTQVQELSCFHAASPHLPDRNMRDNISGTGNGTTSVPSLQLIFCYFNSRATRPTRVGTDPHFDLSVERSFPRPTLSTNSPLPNTHSSCAPASSLSTNS